MKEPKPSSKANSLSNALINVNPERGIWRDLSNTISEVAQHRALLTRLTWREIRSKYKNSSLGLVWSLARPISLMLIYFLAIGEFLGASRAIPDFIIFMFSGFTIWGLFNEIVSAGTGSIVQNAGLVKKIYLPREIFPLSAVGSAFFNFVIQLGLLLILTALLGKFPWDVDFFYLFPATLLMAIFATAIALAFSALNVFFRDIQHILEIALLLLFWCSPIVYSSTLVHNILGGSIIETIYFSNPITISVVGMQKALWISGNYDSSQFWPPHLELSFAVAMGISCALLVGAQRIFSRLEGNFAQEL